jgi:hypothetical protein
VTLQDNPYPFTNPPIGSSLKAGPQLSVVPVPFFGRALQDLDGALAFARGQVDTLIGLHERLGIPVPAANVTPAPPPTPADGAFDMAHRKMSDLLERQHYASELLLSLEKSLV